jgi:hypothetical protein
MEVYANEPRNFYTYARRKYSLRSDLIDAEGDLLMHVVSG